MRQRRAPRWRAGRIVGLRTPSACGVAHSCAIMPVSVGGSTSLVVVSLGSPFSSLSALVSQPAPLEWMFDSRAALDLGGRAHATLAHLEEHMTPQLVHL